MGKQESSSEEIEVQVNNIGGISETTVEISPGVNVLAGRNATNRTSLLQAIMAAIGSDWATIKGDADEAQVKLTLDGQTYTRRLRRDNGSIVTEGDPFLEDATLANLFGFLLEQNEVRQAVAQGDDLRDIIMRPVDTEGIKTQISQLESERDDIDSELDEISSLKRKLPKLEEQRGDLQTQIEHKREELSEKEKEIDNIDANIDEKKEQKDELKSKIEELNNVRNELNTIRNKLDTHQKGIEALETEREELETDLEEYSEISENRIEEIDSEIQRIRSLLNSKEAELDDIQTVIQFNEELLDGSFDLFSDLQEDENGADAVTDQLLKNDEHLLCWTCGSEVDTDQIEAMLDRLRDLRTQATEQRNEFQAQIDKLEEEQISLEEQHRQYEDITTRLDEIEDEIQEREDRVAELQDQRTELTEEVERLETEVEGLRTDDQSELLDLHAEANRLEIEIETLEDDLQEVNDEIADIEERVAQRNQLEAQREEIQAEIEELHTHIERLEQQAIDEFNTHMDTILDILEYENLERVWIERTEQEVREGRRKTTKGQFDLHIVRQTESGAVYEDMVAHLSESEREVTGLVFALAGYLAHELYEDLPFILLDSLEALDSDRIAALTSYFQEYADYVVIALLSEDAEELDNGYRQITDI